MVKGLFVSVTFDAKFLKSGLQVKISKSTALKAASAFTLTLAMILGLFVNSRQAAAVQVVLNPASQASVSPGTIVSFEASILFTDPNEVIPIANLELVLTGPTSHSITFGPLSSQPTGSTSVLSVFAGPPTQLGAGYGYAYGYAPARFGYIGGYGYAISFGAGYGYGYVNAFPSAVGYIRSFTYTFNVNTTTLTAGTYTLMLYVNTGLGGVSQITSLQRSFTVTGGSGGSTTTTTVASPVASATAPPAASTTAISPVINFAAVSAATVSFASTSVGGVNIPLININAPGVAISTNAAGQSVATITLSSGPTGTVTISMPVRVGGIVNGISTASALGLPVLTVTSTSAPVTVGGGASMGTVTVTSTLGSLPTSGTATISIAPPSQIPAATAAGISTFAILAGGGSSNVIGAVVFDHPGITNVGATSITFTLQNPGTLTNPAVIQEHESAFTNPPATFTRQSNGDIQVTVNAKSASTFAVVTLSQPIPSPTPVPAATATPSATVTAVPGTPTVVPTGTIPPVSPTPRPGPVGDVRFSGFTLAVLLGAGLMMLALASMTLRKVWKQ